MNNEELAQSILEHVGGEENIQTAMHCATRLRLTLKDNQKADKKAINDLVGVITVITSNDQFQVVIGNNVSQVYKSLMSLTDLSDTESEPNKVDASKNEKKGISQVLDIISGIFVPIVPVLAGAGMIKALLAVISFFGWMSPEAQTYQLLNVISDAGFYFLPLIIAHSSSVKFKTNPYISMAIGGILLHPSFQAMVQLANETNESINFLRLPVGLVNYGASIIPTILIVWVLSYVEPLVDRIVPSTLKVVISPFITLLVMAPLALVVIGPAGSYLGNILVIATAWIDNYASWLIPTLVGAFTPFIVMVGMHYALISVAINNLATVGFETIAGPGMLVSNIAQGGAVLALSLKTKDNKLKALSVSTGISALLGITEPALYGIELQNPKTLISAMIGGASGGLFLGVTNVVRFSQVPPSIIGLTGYIGGVGLTNLLLAAVGCLIAFVTAFIVQLILGLDKKEKAALEEVTDSDNTEIETHQVKA